ncbi:MAG TPA: hypothetical protein VF120_08240 [Ktedonobacterales bacterium]
MASHRHHAARLLARLAPIALGLVFSLAGALCIFALTPQSALAAPDRPQEAGITGTVVNGTHDNSIVPNLRVTLQSLGGMGTHDLSTVTADGAGRFAFTHLADGDGTVYAAYTRFQQALFTTGPITVQGGTQDVQLLVYDVTSSDAALRITTITALVHDPRPVNGLVGVGEFFTFHNSGNTAYLGSTQPANGLPMNLLRFALPAGATNVTLGTGFDGAQSITVGAGFGATVTVPPGDSQFAFAFDMPYTATTTNLPIKAEYPTDSVLLLVPPAYTAQLQGMDARGPLTSNGAQYNAFTHAALDPQSQVSVSLSGLPPAGESPTLDFGQLALLLAILAALLAGLLAIYIRRGALPFAIGTGGRAGATPTGATPSTDDVDGDGEHLRLLQKLLALQRARAAGDISSAQFRRRTADARAALRSVLAAGLVPSSDARAGNETAGREVARDDSVAEPTTNGALEAVAISELANESAADDTMPAPQAATGGGR